MEAEMQVHERRSGSRRAGRFACVLASLGLLAVVAVACGDDDSDALTKEEYIEQANAICTATNEEIEPLMEEFFEETFADIPQDTPPGDVPTIILAFDEFFDDVLTPAVEDQMEQIRALAPPEEDAEMLADIYDDLQAGLDVVNATLDDAVAGDPAAIEAFSSGASEEQLNEANAAGREYGLTVCGEEG
jgi:hypothetical protein